MNKNDKILVTGANGMVGSALVRELKKQGYTNLLTPTSKEVNLGIQVQMGRYFETHKPDYAFHLAARVGGIQANINNPVEFLNDNLMINCNVFDACNIFNVKKVLYLGSSCIYPTACLQPMKEEYLLTGPLEPTNEGYALAKIVGLKLAEYYYKQYELKTVCLMSCNIYGTGDHYNLENSHVLSALIKKFVDAKENKTNVVVWGDGTARREFIHVDDVVAAILYFFDKMETPEIINIGTGVDVRIYDLTRLIMREIEFDGEVEFDITKPNGMMRKCLDITKMEKYGFETKIDLITGIKKSIKEYKELRE